MYDAFELVGSGAFAALDVVGEQRGVHADSAGQVFCVEDRVVPEEIAQVHAQLEVRTVDPLGRIFETIVQRLHAFIEQLGERGAVRRHRMLLGIRREPLRAFLHAHYDPAGMSGARTQGVLVVFHASQTII